MNTIVRVVVVSVAMLALEASAKHYSFVGGYPANGVSAARAQSVSNGPKVGVTTKKVNTQGKIRCNESDINFTLDMIASAERQYRALDGGERKKVDAQIMSLLPKDVDKEATIKSLHAYCDASGKAPKAAKPTKEMRASVRKALDGNTALCAAVKSIRVARQKASRMGLKCGEMPLAEMLKVASTVMGAR